MCHTPESRLSVDGHHPAVVRLSGTGDPARQPSGDTGRGTWGSAPERRSGQEGGPGPMLSGTNYMGGFTAGAARLRTCPTVDQFAGTAAPIHADIWLGGSKHMTVLPVFNTGRPFRRPSERNP